MSICPLRPTLCDAVEEEKGSAGTVRVWLTPLLLPGDQDFSIGEEASRGAQQQRHKLGAVRSS